MDMPKANTKSWIHNENGFASLIVALTLIIILSLITLGFAQLIRREQRNALNKQLSTQAFYAAESGVNDTINSITNGAGLDKLGDGKNCSSIFASGNALNGVNPVIDSNPDHNVAYTCVLVNPEPGDLKKSISKGKSWSPTFKAVNPATNSAVDLTTMTIKWESPVAGAHTFPGGLASGLTPETGWPGNTGMLRVSITKLGSGASLSRYGLITKTFTTFLYPVTSGGLASRSFVDNTAGGIAAQGAITPVACNDNGSAGYDCSIDLTSLGNGGGGYYMVRVKAVYADADVLISAKYSGGDAAMTGAQVVIDSTGKAQDVLRRIQVRYPLSSSTGLPDVLEAQTVCKRMATWPGGTNFVDPETSINVASGPCYLSS
jgi:hypothetical protein